ncbi:hypothetical protein HG537_0A01030 [Torulaspora globosa]|uniref:ENTH domain-containing protein n=1 Tax=Torulaspora globosa TaxID=48254 RepID=A0A7H9HK73_9SACH|nr:hypothetical protein HG537_0A01030 [Torulaspora sp. CBS 2947]
MMVTGNTLEPAMTTYMKLVKGATKIKMAPPKSKYVEPIILGTADPGEFREVVRALETRISDTAWTVVYKTLIVVHLLMREGERNVAIRYFSTHVSFFELSEIERAGRWASADLRALERYDRYLQTRCEEFDVTGVDYVRDGYSGLKSVSGSGGVRRALDHVASLETQIRALIRNRYSQTDLSNELLLCGFRLLVQDLLSLYKCLNEGIITLLEAFFELTRADAQRTLELYKAFVGLTDDVVKYLKSGKAVGMKIPVIKHITTKLIRSLEEHLCEDDKTHVTFNKEAPESGTSIAQKKLEQIRKQKKLLEQQLQNQQLLVSPTVQQQPYNPFGLQQTDTFTFEQQPTGNPFLNTNGVPQQATGFYSTNQVTPAFTGAGFGGYSNPQQIQPSQTGSHNPFIAEPAHDPLNPFTQPNLQPQPLTQNPFQQQQILVSAQTAPPAPNFGTAYTQLGIPQQTTGYNPFQLQQMQQQQQQQQQNPNLIDI